MHHPTILCTIQLIDVLLFFSVIHSSSLLSFTYSLILLSSKDSVLCTVIFKLLKRPPRLQTRLLTIFLPCCITTLLNDKTANESIAYIVSFPYTVLVLGERCKGISFSCQRHLRSSFHSNTVSVNICLEFGL